MPRWTKQKNVSGIFSRILTQKKLRYETLYRTSFRFLIPGVTNEVNIFLNLMPIWHRFQTEETMEEILNLDNAYKYSLAAELFNWCAHYRQYYWSRHQLHTSFFLYYTIDHPLRRITHFPQYMKEYTEKSALDNPEFGALNQLIYDNLKLATDISKFIPHVYIFNIYDFDLIGLPFNFIRRLRKKNSKAANLIFTNNELDYMALRSPYTKIAIDNTFGFLHRDEVFSYICYKNKIKDLVNRARPLEFCHFPLMMALKGDVKHGIPNVNGFKTFHKAMEFVSKCRNDWNIINDKHIKDIRLFLDLVHDYLDEEQREQMKLNYYFIHPETNTMFLSKTTNRKIEEEFQDLEDNQSIMTLNQTYFPYNNIQLIELMQGEYRIINNTLVKY